LGKQTLVDTSFFYRIRRVRRAHIDIPVFCRASVHLHAFLMKKIFEKIGLFASLVITFALKIILFAAYMVLFFPSAVYVRFFRDDMGLKSKPSWKKCQNCKDTDTFMRNQ